MRFDILTLFPEPVEAMMHSSILGRAQKKGLIEIHALRRRTRRDFAVRSPVPVLVRDLRRYRRAGTYNLSLCLRKCVQSGKGKTDAAKL